MEGGSDFIKQLQKATQSAQAVLPREQRVAIFTNEGVRFFRLVENGEGPFSLEPDQKFGKYPLAEQVKFAPHKGHQVSVLDEIGIHLIDMQTGQEMTQIVKEGVSAIEYSPLDTFLISCEKYAHGKKNLVVWSSLNGKELACFEFRKSSKEGARSIKFSSDESFCARLESPHLISFYDLSGPAGFDQCAWQIAATPELLYGNKAAHIPRDREEVKFDGLDFIPLNPNIPPQYAPRFFVCWKHAEALSDKDENHGMVFVYDVNSVSDRPKFKVECKRAQDITLKPSPHGHAMLVWSQNFVDTSGKSYYGEHSLQYVQLAGGKQRSFVPIFDYQVHDVCWTHDEEKFIVISGMQPGTATLYDKNCNPLFEFGKRYRNTIRICPFSNLCLIGGFGNLAGEMDFWSLDSLKELGKTKAYCSVSVEWAPNGKFLMTGVLFERVKVDNELRVISPGGQQLLLCPFPDQELQEVHWQPFAPGSFAKPKLSDLILKPSQEETKKLEDKPKKKLYVPPGGGNSAFQQLMRQEMSKTNEKGPRAVDKYAYQDLAKEQAHTLTQQQSKAPAGQADQYEPSWRAQEPYVQQQQVQNVAQEDKQVSKHAKRRAKKKQKDQEQKQNDG